VRVRAVSNGTAGPKNSIPLLKREMIENVDIAPRLSAAAAAQPDVGRFPFEGEREAEAEYR